MKNVKEIIGVIVVVLAAILIALGLIFSWQRWWSVDDVADIQGTWQVEGTETTFVISADEMAIADDVIYKYELNTSDKTIDLTLGTMSGKSHYVFSQKRTQLVIIDADVDFFSSLSLDLSDRISSILDGTFSDLNAGFINTSIDESEIVRLNKLDS